MRIGFDARFLTHPQRGGFKTYTVNLLRALAQVDECNEYMLVVDRCDARAAGDWPPRFVFQVSPNRCPVVGAVIRQQIVLRRVFRVADCDLVHFPCNTGPICFSGKYVLTLHDIIALTQPQSGHGERSRHALKRWALTRYWAWVTPPVARRAERIITVSRFERAQIAACLGIPLERIIAIPLAASQHFRPLSNAERERTRRRFRLFEPCMLGIGFEPRKNIEMLLEAFAHMPSDLRDRYQLVLVIARVESQVRFQRRAQKLGIEGRVRCLGPLPPEDLAGLYNLSDCFVFPSKRESFGLPPLEAMACGTPVIAADSSSIPEVVGDAAVLVDASDVEAIAEAMARVLTDVDLRHDLRERGLQRAQMFSWERCARETLAVYESVISDCHLGGVSG